MRPKPFRPEPIERADLRYMRDSRTTLVWHHCTQRTLYADTDRSQVIYHANYLRYFEFGRASLMRDAQYPYKEIEESGFIYPIIELGLKYYHPLHYDDLMRIYTRPGEKERVRLTFDYLVTLDDAAHTIVCTGFTRHCAINAKGQPVAIDPKTALLWRYFPAPIPAAAP